MNWMDKLERKIGRYAVPNLMLYIIIMYGAGYVLYLINPAFYAQYLCLNAQAILHGQVWRIITFIIQPPSYSLDAGGIISLLFYRERTGTGMGDFPF